MLQQLQYKRFEKSLIYDEYRTKSSPENPPRDQSKIRETAKYFLTMSDTSCRVRGSEQSRQNIFFTLPHFFYSSE